jgi:hypothetical protein
VHVTVRYDARTGTVLAHRRARQPREGRVGPGAAGANLVLGLPETTGLSRRSDSMP